jgi:hypothetical protein
MGLAIGAFVLFAIISGAGNNIPYLGVLVAAFLIPPIEGGFTRFNLNLVNRNNPQITDLFAEFVNYPKWLGTYWLRNAIAMACALPIGIAAIVMLVGERMSGLSEPSTAIIVGLVGGGLVTLVLALLIMPRLAFMMYLAAEGYGPVDALQTSMRMVQNRFGEVLWNFFVLELFGGLGILACGVGIIYTGPLAYAAMTCYYNAVKAQEGIPTYQ